MIHSNPWFTGSKSQSFDIAEPYQKGRGQAGPPRHSKSVQFIQGATCQGKGLFHHRIQSQEMLPRGQFRHHTSKGAVLLDLGGNLVTQKTETSVFQLKDGDRGLVAGAFDSQQSHGVDERLLGGKNTQAAFRKVTDSFEYSHCTIQLAVVDVFQFCLFGLAQHVPVLAA